MKRFIFPLLLVQVLLLLTLSACAQTGEPAVVRQEINVNLAPGRHYLSGDSTLVLVAGARKISFDLSPAATVDQVTVDGRAAQFSFGNSTLTVDLPHGKDRATILVKVVYHATFNDQVPDQLAGDEDPTYGVNGTIGSQGVFLGGSAGWYPAPSATPGRRVVRISAPAGIEAVTAGKRISRSTHLGVTSSAWEEGHPVGRLSLSAGPYMIKERIVDGMSVYTYFYPDNADLAAGYLDAAAKYLHFYQKLLGPYPFEKFAVVENFLPTGYGFPSYTLLGGTIIRLPFIIDTSLPHEIAHNWWGNGVLVDYREGNWCEGLVTYLADYLLEEKKSAAAGRDYRIRLISDYSSLVTPDRDFPLRSFVGRIDPASRAIGYGKGAMVFHMVRSMIGDEAFFGTLREMCRTWMYRKAVWSDFTRAFSRGAGKDLAPFMEQWLLRPGGPHLSLKGVTNKRQGAEWVVSGSVVQTSPPYELLLPLRLETVGSAVSSKVVVTGKTTPFGIAAPAAPKRLLLDPDADLFRLLTPVELPPTINRVKGSENLLLVVAKSCQADQGTMQLLLASLGQQRTAVINEDVVDAQLVHGRDILFCGVPRPGLLPVLPEGIAISSSDFTLFGERFGKQDDLLFLVLRNPNVEGHVMALFLPLSEAAARQYVPKITHYGSYGYLAFANGENRIKGRFPPLAGGSMVEFGKDGGQ